MWIIDVQNTCQALPQIVDYLMYCGREEHSRAGDVLVAPHPVMTVTRHPTERVLFSPVRDANPFFHLYEAFWMLAGRDDAASLDLFVKNFGERFAEPDGVIADAYGRRWRSAFGFDQLDHVVHVLRQDGTSRQAVIQMWDCRLSGENDACGTWVGRPCNTTIYLRIHGDRGLHNLGHGNVEDFDDRVLDLTVCCRSNDMILGATGANSVHFSILQEYLAARIGVKVGTMYQLSNNAHIYITEIERLKNRIPEKDKGLPFSTSLLDNRYFDLEPRPLFNAPDHIDEDIRSFMEWHDADLPSPIHPAIPASANYWFIHTLNIAMVTHWFYRKGKIDKALEMAEWIVAPDWRIACIEWLNRRKK